MDASLVQRFDAFKTNIAAAAAENGLVFVNGPGTDDVPPAVASVTRNFRSVKLTAKCG